MSKKTPPLTGVQSLPGFEAPKPSLPLAQQRSFGALVTPEAIGATISDFADISQEAVEAASPQRLRSGLIDVAHREDDNSVGFFEPILHRRIYVALTPGEYTLITRNVPSFGQQAVTNTLGSKISLVKTGDEVDARATRSGVHQVEAKMEGLQRYLDASLLSDKTRLERFMEYAQHYWFRRQQEATMRSDLTWIRTHTFEDMFTAIRHQREWDDVQEKLARRAVNYRLFLMREGNQHIQNWQAMLSLAYDYNNHKIALFKDRIHESRRYIRKNSTQ